MAVRQNVDAFAKFAIIRLIYAVTRRDEHERERDGVWRLQVRVVNTT